MKDVSEVVSAEPVRLALQQWHMTNQLGQNRLSRLNQVEEIRIEAGYSQTDAGYGLALRTHLQQVLEAIRPDGEIDLTSKVWRPYLSITRHFIDGDHRDTVMDDLHVARRTFYQAVNQAIEAIVDHLCMLEEKNHLAPTLKLVQNGAINSFLTFVPPLPPQSLIVRSEIIAQMKAQLLAGKDVSSSGLPGIGKTTLCSYIAYDDEIQGHFSDGILWVGLGQNPDLLLILGEWGSVLGITLAQLEQTNDVVGRARLIHQAIGAKRILFIIDDVWDSMAAFSLQIGGEQCAHLVTSRYSTVALDFTANHFPLTALPTEVGVQFLHKLAPVLIQSAPTVSHTLTDMVGGLPLALMLIGHHIRKYGANPQKVSAIIETLQLAETRINLTQTHHPLHRRPDLLNESTLSLYLVINLSYERLSVDEQNALCALTLFPPRPNTFSETAALAVIDQPQTVLDALVANGLIESSMNGRYTIHQTIADFGTVQQSQMDDAVVRFLTWFSRPSEAVDYEVEAENLRTAMKFAISSRRPLLGGQLFYQFDQFFVRRGLLEEQFALLQQLHVIATEKDDDMALAHITYWMGSNLTSRRLYTLGRPYLENALKLFKKHQLPEQHLKTVFLLSLVCQRLGQFEDGYVYCQEGIPLCDRLGQEHDRVSLHNSLSFLAFQRGQYTAAIQHLEQAIEYEQYVTIDMGVITRSNRAWITVHLGNYADCMQAVDWYDRLLDDVHQIDHVGIHVIILHGIALAGCRLGDWKQARQAADEATSITTTSAIGLHLRTKRICGYVATAWGQYDYAEQLYDDVMSEAQLHEDKLEMVALLNQRSHLARLQKRFDEAIKYTQAALEMAETMQIPPMKAAALHHLGTAQLAIGESSNAAQSLYQALAIYQSLNLHHFTIPIHARLAKCALARGNTTDAHAHIKPVLDYVESCALKAVEDRFEIYKVVHDVLSACGEEDTAHSLMKTAHEQLTAEANTIGDRKIQRHFIRLYSSRLEAI